MRVHVHVSNYMWFDFCYSCIWPWGFQRKVKLLGFWSFHHACSMSIKASLAGWTAGCRTWSAGSQETFPNTANGKEKKTKRDCFMNMRKMSKNLKAFELKKVKALKCFRKKCSMVPIIVPESFFMQAELWAGLRRQHSTTFWRDNLTINQWLLLILHIKTLGHFLFNWE